jgi:5-hydroxyisourate hydrolase
MSGKISTHVLDITTGKPGFDIEVTLECQVDSGWKEIARKRTDKDGRATVLESGSGKTEVYRLTFDTSAYWSRHETKTFFPNVMIAFEAVATEDHFHVPLLLSPFAYSTYRGS